jgi:hypothetical protein
MSRVMLGVIRGLSIAIVDVLVLLPLSFPDKRTTRSSAAGGPSVGARGPSARATGPTWPGV